jgi:hypothetical protein
MMISLRVRYIGIYNSASDNSMEYPIYNGDFSILKIHVGFSNKKKEKKNLIFIFEILTSLSHPTHEPYH